MRGKLFFSKINKISGRITPADAGKTVIGLSYMQRHQDHPRGCGENITAPDELGNVMGSPPRMRGKPANFMSSAFASRITPADAGKTVFCRCCLRRPRDHPRGCGENVNRDSQSPARMGSPPRMRGKPPTQTPCTARARITPADAGKTSKNRRGVLCGADHPRGCGENTDPITYRWADVGSPPRMRGKQNN